MSGDPYADNASPVMSGPDPWAPYVAAAAPKRPTFTPVDHDPFAAPAAPQGPTFTPVDHDPFAAFPDHPDPSQIDPWAAFVDYVPPAPSRVANGPSGLFWDAAGGHDPQTGTLVVAGKPMSDGAPSQALAASSGVLSGVPVIGPALQRGVADLSGWLHSGGTTPDDAAAQAATVAQGRMAAAQTAYPNTTTAGNVVGGAAALAPAISAAPALFGAEGGGLTAGKVGMGAASGMALGGADSAVRGGGEPSAIVMGVGGGALGGAVGPVVGAAAGNAARFVADAAARAFNPVPGMAPAVARALGQTIANDGTDAAAGAARIGSAGPYGMLVDASPSLGSTLDAALQRGGPGSAAARQAIEARTAGTGADLNATLDQTLGPYQGVGAATDALRANTAAARQAAYTHAYAQAIDYTSPEGMALEDMIRNRVPPGIIARATNQMRVDGQVPTQQVMARQQPDGSFTYEHMPDVRMVDYITRSLQDVSRAGDGQGALGGNTAEGRSYGQLGRQLRDALRQAVPEYGAALDTAAQPIQERNALDFGASLLRPSTPRDVAAATVQDMTAPELTQARAGVRAHIADTLANVQRTITDPNVDARQAMAGVKMLSSDAAMEKLGLLMGQPEAQAMNTALGRAAAALQLRANVTGNSRTFARGAINDAIDTAAQPSFLSRLLMAGGPMKATRPIAEVLTGNTPAQVMQRGDDLAGGLAQALTTQAPRPGACCSSSSMRTRLAARRPHSLGRCPMARWRRPASCRCCCRRCSSGRSR